MDSSDAAIYVEAVLHVRKPDSTESYFTDFTFNNIPIGSDGSWTTHTLNVSDLVMPSGTVILGLNLRFFFRSFIKNLGLNFC